METFETLFSRGAYRTYPSGGHERTRRQSALRHSAPHRRARRNLPRRRDGARKRHFAESARTLLRRENAYRRFLAYERNPRDRIQQRCLRHRKYGYSGARLGRRERIPLGFRQASRKRARLTGKARSSLRIQACFGSRNRIFGYPSRSFRQTSSFDNGQQDLILFII